GGVAVDAHLVLQTAAANAVALTQRAIVVDQELGNDKQAEALDALRRALDPGQNRVDDVFGEVVLARRDPYLLAGDLVAAVSLRDRLGAHHAEVRATLGLGQVHRATPLAGGHFRQVLVLDFIRGIGAQTGIGASRQ